MLALKTSGNTIDNQASNNHLIYCICTCGWKGMGETNTNDKSDQQPAIEGEKIGTPPNVFPFP